MVSNIQEVILMCDNVCFDNVGGDILDLVMGRMAMK